MLFKEITIIYTENHRKDIHKISDLINVKADLKYVYHRVLKG
jgi:hypothetical protein